MQIIGVGGLYFASSLGISPVSVNTIINEADHSIAILTALDASDSHIPGLLLIQMLLNDFA